MTLILQDRVRESTTTTGTGPVTLNGAVGGYRRFSAVMSVGDTCWYTIALPGGAWETGRATYTALNTLSRTTVFNSSNADALVNFGPGTKDVFLCLPASKAPFDTGTLMLFQQTTAPVGWTKQTTHNDKALRVVSGTASSGGTNAFSTVMAQTVVGGTAISIAQMPAHSHTNLGPLTQTLQPGGVNIGTAQGSTTTGSTGGGASHDHTITMNIQYVDLIIARKD